MNPVRTRTAHHSRNRRFIRIKLDRRVFLGLSLFALFIFLKVWQKVTVETQVRRNGLLKEQLFFIESENALLQAQIEELRSLERIGRIAGNDLNLVPIPKIKIQEKSALQKFTEKFDPFH